MKSLAVAATLAALCLMPVSARAEDTVWIWKSTPTLTVTETQNGYLVSNGKARFTVARGEKLPAVFQTHSGKVLRAGPPPRR